MNQGQQRKKRWGQGGIYQRPKNEQSLDLKPSDRSSGSLVSGKICLIVLTLGEYGSKHNSVYTLKELMD